MDSFPVITIIYTLIHPITLIGQSNLLDIVIKHID